MPASTFEDAAEWLAERAVSLLAERKGGRVVVGITGPPGGGKSTLSAAVRERADALLLLRGDQKRRRRGDPDQPLAVVLPMDGFHYTRAQLDAFPDPAAAHARRGAPWTFDAAAFVATVARARESNSDSAAPLLVPSFDHAVKDPVEGQIEIGPQAEIVLVEGNYLLLDEEPWRRLWWRGRREEGEQEQEGAAAAAAAGAQGDGPPPPPPLLDETWFVDAPLEAAMGHIFARQTGDVGLSADESRWRVEENDAPNARLVAATRPRAGVLVPGELPMRGDGQRS